MEYKEVVKRMERKIRIIVLLVLSLSIFFIVTGCQSGKEKERAEEISQEEDEEEDLEKEDLEEEEDSEESVEVVVVEDPVEFALSEPDPFTHVKFQKEEDRAVTLEYEPRTGGSLSVTDATGTVWTLEVPPFSLATAQTIRMIPLTNLEMDAGPSIFHGGVLLEPDGLTFMTSAQMTVTRAGMENLPVGDDKEPVLASGSADGDLTEWILADQGYPIMHFSSLVFTDRGTLREQKTIPGLESEAEENLSDSIEMAKDFLEENKNEISVLAPPVYPMECQTKEDQASLDEGLKNYIEKALQPESDLAHFLLHDLEKLSLVRTIDIQEEEAYQLALKLLWRNQRKAERLLDQYEGQPDYLVPVTLLAMTAAKDANMLYRDDEANEALYSRLIQWLEASVDPLIEELREQHNYRLARVLVRLASWQSSLGLTFDQVEPILEQVRRAMNFELELDVHYVTPDSDFGIFGIFNLTYNEDMIYWEGKNSPGFSFVTAVPDTTMSGAPGVTSVMMNEFNPCEGVGRFLLDQFWATDEVMSIDGESVPMPITRQWWEYCFSEQANDIGEEGLPGFTGDTLYAFPFEVINGQAIAAQGEVKGQENSGGKMDVTFTYKLLHAPK